MLFSKGDEKMSVGKNVKEIRFKRNINQVELAEKVGITQAMLCQIERGTKNPSLQVAYEISKVLECDIEKLMEE